MKYLNKLLFIAKKSETLFLAIIVILILTISGCNTVKKAKVEDFSVNMNSPQITVGEIELQLEVILGFGRIKKQTVTVLYFPREDVVGIKYKFDFHTYYQFWNKRGRLSFISALHQYNTDYETRDLQRRGNSLQKYGNVRGYQVWQRSSFTIQAFANLNIDLGYTFRDKSPYFSVYQHEAYYLDDLSKDNNRTSPKITMCFTRAQAAELAEIFEQYITPEIDIPYENEETGIPAVKDNIPRDSY
jgi:uncharacterized protein YcfL